MNTGGLRQNTGDGSETVQVSAICTGDYTICKPVWSHQWPALPSSCAARHIGGASASGATFYFPTPNPLERFILYTLAGFGRWLRLSAIIRSNVTVILRCSLYMKSPQDCGKLRWGLYKGALYSPSHIPPPKKWLFSDTHIHQLHCFLRHFLFCLCFMSNLDLWKMSWVKKKLRKHLSRR